MKKWGQEEFRLIFAYFCLFSAIFEIGLSSIKNQFRIFEMILFWKPFIQ
jgi:hypothetical protein